MIMLIDLNSLNKSREIEFKYEVIKDEKLDTRIKDLNNAFVKGKVYLNYENDIVLDCVFKGIMFIVDSISLEEVPYEFELSIEENLDELIKNYEKCYNDVKNTLDLKIILWQNIVLEVPISYTRVSDAHLKGNGWELVNENKLVEEIDPRLKKLEELLERRD